MEERNPSPPREFEDDAEKFRQDMIGETTISKRWVYSILMDMCNEVDKHGKINEDCADVSEELQDEICRLWDLCVEEDVACFLAENGTVSLLCSVISESKSPRLTEMTVGILGNMACTAKACQVITDTKEAQTVISSLFSCRDSPTLVEVGRLINTCLQDGTSKDSWLDFMEVNLPGFLEDITFILCSSTNEALLKNILEMIDSCLDSRDHLLGLCIEKQFINSVAEAGLQLSKDDENSEGMFICLHILYLVTTVNGDAAVVFKDNSKIYDIALVCCQKWKDLNDFNIATANPSPIPVASCFSVINFLLDVSYTSEGDNAFLNLIPKSQRDIVLIVYDLTLKFCEPEPRVGIKKVIGDINDGIEKRETENLDDKKSEKSSTLNSAGSTTDNHGSSSDGEADNDESKLFHGVPLYDITKELTETLTRISWLK